MFSIADDARKHGDNVWTFSVAPRHKGEIHEGHEYFSSFFEYAVHYVLGKATGGNGFFSSIPTIHLIHRLKAIGPDVIHLHNIHGFCINIPILFNYLKKKNIPIVWTLHDCWTFTGHCTHYVSFGCDKWKTGCYHCPIYKNYPESNIDNSKWMWKAKRKWFTGLKKAVLVTPSKWLASQVSESYLKDYPIKVFNNGIDLTAFKPLLNDAKKKYGITENKKIVLGVAFGWGYRKGLDVFIRLSEELGDNYQVVLVGTSSETDKCLPPMIVSIHRTINQGELVELYSLADVFVNPTREDTFPTVNIEALACGTPVITFATGGSPEIISPTCGIVVPCNDVLAMENAIHKVTEENLFSSESCRSRAERYNMNSKFDEYIELYHELCK